MKRIKPAYVLALLLFAAGAGYLVFSGIAANSVYFVTVAEAKTLPPDRLSAARVFGVVRAADKTEGAGARFFLQDSEQPADLLYVRYLGIPPDTFENGAEVIVEGGLGTDADAGPSRAGRIFPDKVFLARTLITKCPSKYEKEQRNGPADTR